MRRDIALTLLAIAAAFAVFALWPQLDLRVSRMAFQPGFGFPLATAPWSEALRKGLWNLSTVMVLIAVFGFAATLIARRAVFGLRLRVWGFILLLYALSTGILVNLLLKEHWGRARPNDVTDFGGAMQFTPPYQIAHQCLHNCSFVSGETSGTMALAISLLLILSQIRDRVPAYRLMQALILLLPLLAGGQRILAGRHFLSDVLLAALFTTLVAQLLWWGLNWPKKQA